MHDPDRYGMSDARRRDRHLHRVGPNQHRSEACHCTIQHRRRDIEPYDRSPTAAKAERHDSCAHSDLQYYSVPWRELGVHESGVLVSSALPSARLVIAFSQLIEFTHERIRDR